MLLLNDSQKIYIASLVAVILLTLVVALFCLYKFVYAKKHYKEATYLILSRYAKNNDYLLLNNYKIDFDDKHVGYIDHILITNKYIFIINDFSLSGVISGELKERYLKVVNYKKEVEEINNPLNYNINLIKRFNIYNNLDSTFVKGIVVIDNDSVINIKGMSSSFMMTTRNKLKSVINNFERDNVKNLKEETVVKFINYLDRSNKG